MQDNFNDDVSISRGSGWEGWKGQGCPEGDQSGCGLDFTRLRKDTIPKLMINKLYADRRIKSPISGMSDFGD